MATRYVCIKLNCQIPGWHGTPFAVMAVSFGLVPGKVVIRSTYAPMAPLMRAEPISTN